MDERNELLETLPTGQTKVNVSVLVKLPHVREHFLRMERIVRYEQRRTTSQAP